MINSINSGSSGYLSQLSNNETVNLLIAAATKTDNSQTVSNVFESSSDSSDSSSSSSDLSFLEYMELMKNSKSANVMSTEEDSTNQAGDVSAIDADGDGTISADEYETMISQMGINNAISADEFFSQYDTDGDGELTVEEYNAKDSNMMPPPPMGLPPQLDTDADGTLSSDEYENMISQLGIDDALSADEFFSTYDTNQDGELSADELQAMSESLNSSYANLTSSTIKAYETNYQYMFENAENSNLNQVV